MIGPASNSAARQAVIYTRLGGLTPILRMITPALSPNTPPNISQDGIECHFYTPHLRLSQQYLNIALTMHNKT